MSSCLSRLYCFRHNGTGEIRRIINVANEVTFDFVRDDSVGSATLPVDEWTEWWRKTATISHDEFYEAINRFRCNHAKKFKYTTLPMLAGAEIAEVEKVIARSETIKNINKRLGNLEAKYDATAAARISDLEKQIVQLRKRVNVVEGKDKMAVLADHAQFIGEVFSERVSPNAIRCKVLQADYRIPDDGEGKAQVAITGVHSGQCYWENGSFVTWVPINQLGTIPAK